LAPLDGYLHCLARQIRLRDLARQHGWACAQRLQEGKLRDELLDCRREIDRIVTLLPEPPESPFGQRLTLSAPDVYRDLVALEREFEEVGINLGAKQLIVTTEPIVLEMMEFGPFEIRLDWARLGQPSPYKVVALDPNPAARDETITHPHVQDEHLCEGEARAAIRAALREGRLYDFYLLVVTTLRTYGQGSAYVTLTNWHGWSCSDCASTIDSDDDDNYSCERCSTTLCSDCANSCRSCGSYCCARCSSYCDACDERSCNTCFQDCCDCDSSFCGMCLNYHSRCSSCQETHDAPTPPSPVPSPAPSVPETPVQAAVAVASAAAAVHAPGVGQAAVSAGSGTDRGRPVRRQRTGRSAAGRGGGARRSGGVAGDRTNGRRRRR